MKIITKNTDYAIRALLELSLEEERFVSAKEIADHQHIPYEFLRKILSSLIKENMVESREGGSGGFQLKRSPAKIRLTDLIKIFQGEVQLSACMLRKKICPERRHCVLRKNILQVEQKVIDEFKSITIESLRKQTAPLKSNGVNSRH
jgi:Rrf2 family protein